MRSIYISRLIFGLALLVVGVLLPVRPDAGSVAAAGTTLVWPIHEQTTPDYAVDTDQRISSTFGPRQKASATYRYDWHRGIDIPAECDTPVHAVAAGTVRLAGDYSSYEDRVVQIRHTKTGGGTYYSNYMHLATVAVTETQVITQGAIIGYTGESEIGYSGTCTDGYDPSVGNGFDHLHFEIRDGGLYQKHATHPLLFLPYTDSSAPQVSITSVNLTNPARPEVQVHVTLPTDQLDLNRVEVTVYNTASGQPVQVDQEVFDIINWNLNYTTFGTTTNLKILDTAPAYDGVYDSDYGQGTVSPAPYGVTVSPAVFNVSSANYVLDLKFFDLNGAANAGNVLIKAKAVDINGNSNEVSSP